MNKKIHMFISRPLFFLSAVFLIVLVSIIYADIFLVSVKTQNTQLQEEVLAQAEEMKQQNDLLQAKTQTEYGEYIMNKRRIYLIHNDKRTNFYLADNEVTREDDTGLSQTTHDGYEKSHLKISPQNGMIGYFSFLNYSKLKETTESDYDNETSLSVMTIDGKNHKEVYRGNYHTSDWEWLNEDEIVVYYGCGTECEVGFVIDAKTGKRKAQLQYGVGYEWSPDKKLVVAYNYSVEYGITVGNKKGNELYALRRGVPDFYSRLVDKTKAAWSPDGSKIALIIKKENQEALELVVFDVKKNFQTISQSDLEILRSSEELSWSSDAKKLVAGNVEIVF